MDFFLAVSSMHQAIDEKANKILYIEDGCLKDRRDSDRYLVVKKPLENAREVLEAIWETDKIQEDILEILTNALNDIHKRTYRKEVWRIILTPWLEYYIEAMYNRLINVNEALKYGQIYSYALDEKVYKPNFFWEDFWLRALCDEKYNFQLYSNVLRFKGVDIKKNVVLDEAKDGSIAKHQRLLEKVIHLSFKETVLMLCQRIECVIKKNIVWLVRKVNNLLSYKVETIIINPQNFGFGIKELFNIKIKSKFKIGFYYTNATKIKKNLYEKKKRDSILINNKEDDSELKKMLLSYIRQDIPIIFLEGLDRGIGSIKRFQCKKLISADDCVNYEATLLMAMTKNRHGKIYIIQLGGDADILQGKPESFMDARIADVLYSGGWHNNGLSCEMRKITNPRYWKAKNAVKKIEKKYDIMYVGTATSSYRLLLSNPAFLVSKEYVNDSIELVAHLAEDREYKVKARFFNFETGWHLNERLQERCKSVKLDDYSKRFIDTVQECKLCVVDAFGTPWAEALVMNIPLIIVIPKYLEYFSEHGWRLVEKLRKIGIYYNSYTEVIECLDQIDNINHWWENKQQDIQQIRDQYCWCAEDPKKEWLKEFIKISKE